MSRLSFVVAAATVVLMLSTEGLASVGAGGLGASTAGAAQDSGSRYLGQVKLMNRRGSRPARSVSAEDVLVLFTPAQARAASNPRRSTAQREVPVEMKMENKAYEPRMLAVQKGEAVRFPNMDAILHNVFSVSGNNAFDLGLYGRGKSQSKSFEESGLVRVFCNVHRDMMGFIWVLDTPHFTQPRSDGSFALDGISPGPGTLTVWHERSEPLEIRVESGSELRQLLKTPIELRITRPRVPSHSRKDGSAYRSRSSYTGG